MEGKKTFNNFLTPDSDRDNLLWMMSQRKASPPNMAPGLRGLYPSPFVAGSQTPAGISAIRHILPQIPTRGSNPRTAVSKASLREPFSNVPRSDTMFSGIHASDPSGREIIWREDWRDVPSREGQDQAEMDFTKFEWTSKKVEAPRDMPLRGPREPAATLKNAVVESVPTKNDLCKSIEQGVMLINENTEDTESSTKDSDLPYELHEKKLEIDGYVSGAPKSHSSVENETISVCDSPVSSTQSKEVVTLANPIKLKIRCDFKEGQKGLMAVIGKDSDGSTKPDVSAESVASCASGAPLSHVPTRQPSPQGVSHLGLAPPSPQTFSHSAAVPSPSTNIVRPKTGRAKTNAELKKQLMEKRAVQYLKGQSDGGSQASSPATSHVDVSSPASLQADASSPSSVQAEGTNSDVVEPLQEHSHMTKRKQDGRTKSLGDSFGTAGRTSLSAEDQQQPADTKWVVGDMLWARVSGHPWWPCIVSPDPFQQIFTKIVSRGQKISFRQYHVQFFGEEGERGWVQESSAIPFEGRFKFDNFCQEMIREHKKDKKNYTVAANRRRAWEVAVSSAEHARTMPRVRRIEEYVAVYDETPPVSQPPVKEERKEAAIIGAKAADENASKGRLQQQQHVKPPRKSVDDPLLAAARSAETGSPPHKKPKLADSPVVESPSHIKLPKNVSNQHVVQFTVFCQKRREAVKNEHPDYDEEQVEDALQEQWSKLDDETRSRFIPMGSDFTFLSQMMATAGVPKVATGVKRSSRFVKVKKPTQTEKQERQKHKQLESAGDEEQIAVKKEGIQKERRSQGSRSSNERKVVDAEFKSRRSQDSVNGKASEVEASSPAVSPSERTSVRGIPPKKRGRKSKDYRSPSTEGKSDIDSAGRPNPSKNAAASVAAGRKEAAAPSKSITDCDDDETEEELDDANICFVCEKANKGIERCQGPCCGLFHPSCLGHSVEADGKFQCEDCTTGVQKCFVCKQSGQETVPCVVDDCGRFYHEECLKTFLPEGVTVESPLSCPLHCCFTCQLKKADKASNSEDDNDFTDLFVCVRCPTAYHMTDSCLSAGSIGLTGKYIVCSRHFEPSKTHSLHTRTSCTWCFACEKGGSLVNCDSCPAAYHASCLEIGTPSGAWQCPDCSRGKRPLYGDLVWVKFGSYRWWPAEIYHPASLPLNIQDLPHQVGEFPVCFFGSHDYLWIHRGRVFPFKEGDKCCREADSKGTAKIFDKAMKEAIAVYRMLNPNSKEPAGKMASDDGVEKPVSRKRKRDDGSDDEDEKDIHDDTNTVPKSSERKAKKAKTKPNSKVLRLMQRQSQVLQMTDVSRLTDDGQPLQMVNEHETACYRCGQTGQLILCDKPKCPKAYHLKCIRKSKLPHGMWLCPWHHCETCGKAAIQMCSRCPNSYCADHVSSKITFSVEHGMTCFHHPDVVISDESQNFESQLVTLYPDLNPVPRQTAKDSSEVTKKKTGKKSAQKSKLSSPSPVVGKRVASLRKSVAEYSDSSGKVDDEERLKIVESSPPKRSAGKGSIRQKKDKAIKSSSKSCKSERAAKSGSRDHGSSSRSSDPSQVLARSNDQQLVPAMTASGKKQLVQSNSSPMFDNSDDEFPQLVIDVPTL